MAVEDLAAADLSGAGRIDLVAVGRQTHNRLLERPAFPRLVVHPRKSSVDPSGRRNLHRYCHPELATTILTDLEERLYAIFHIGRLSYECTFSRHSVRFLAIETEGRTLRSLRRAFQGWPATPTWEIVMKSAWLLVYSVCLRFVPAVAGLASVGCATVMGGSRDQDVRISSTPLGAMVLVDCQPKGTTPVNVLLSRKSDHDVDIQLAGYQSYHTTIRSGFNPWVLGNILLGGPVGLVIDLVADSCYRLDPGDNKAVLHPGYLEAANVPAGQPFALHPPP